MMKVKAMAVAVISAAVVVSAASAYAESSSVSAGPSASVEQTFTCTFDAPVSVDSSIGEVYLKLVRNGHIMQLHGRLAMPSPGYTVKLGPVKPIEDELVGLDLTVVTPSETQLAVIDALTFEENLDWQVSPAQGHVLIVDIHGDSNAEVQRARCPFN